MEREVPSYFIDKSRVIDIHREVDGSYNLKLLIEIHGQNEFIPFLSYKTITEEEKKELEWINDFKRKYSHLWSQGYELASKPTLQGDEIWGYVKEGEFFELETYRSPTWNGVNFPVIIKVKSLILENEYEVFNSQLHGYDAIISTQKNMVDTVKFKKKRKCKFCSCETYRLYVNIHGTGEKDLLVEQPCEGINEKNWMNAFDFISIDLECSKCKKGLKRWFEFETM